MTSPSPARPPGRSSLARRRGPAGRLRHRDGRPGRRLVGRGPPDRMRALPLGPVGAGGRRSGWRATVRCCWCAPRSATGAGCGGCCAGAASPTMCFACSRRPRRCAGPGCCPSSACWPWWPAKPRRSGTAGSRPAVPRRLPGTRARRSWCRSCWWRRCWCWRGWRRRSCRCSTPPAGWRSRLRSPASPCCWPARSPRWPPRWSRWSAAAFVLPGPGWLPVALLLPSLALCAFALAAATVVGPRAAAVTAGALWALPALLLAATHVPLAIVQWHAQSRAPPCCALCVVVLMLRRDRFELGWMR